MASTIRRPMPQLRIIQQEFTRSDKRSHPDSRGGSNSDEDEDGRSRTGSSEPPTKIRKKPGRKPNPASPAVRKEQNRAAQRAFRDRKERHLQEMETTIKELQDTNTKIMLRLQEDAKQFKSSLQALQSENYYLREVVCSFESALSKDGNVSILQEVKSELYRRHYDKHSAKRLTGTGMDNQETDTRTSAPIPSAFIPNGCLPLRTDDATSHQAQYLDRPSTAAYPISSSTSAIPSSSEQTTPSPPFESAMAASQALKNASKPVAWSNTTKKPVNSQDDTQFTTNNDILYKAPSFIPTIFANSARTTKSNTPMEPSSRPPHNSETGVTSRRRTEYTKQPTVFDELQSSLFPPGTLRSIIHSNMPTPLEIVNDVPLLDQLYDHRTLRDPVIAPSGQNTLTLTTTSSSSSSVSAHTSVDESCSIEPPSPSFLDDDTHDFRLATSTLGLDDGLKQAVFPSKRLQLEIRVLASAPPVVDPNIDPKIYALPHDSRIDLIPCPKLRAHMILHQNKYDIEDLCQLLINGAICHGHPLDPHSWELPEVFFDRYGFLLGQEMLRHRNKIWPKKDEPMAEVSRAH
ncbi:hypothetical protein KVV02_007888 [Mortierella alpina]|uniref:BZIP domain-containing protein n=1 Tax=Mortierella alpina TaxID=64518 RepID=A0A9P8A1W8_MORAP|nr:hypothetical protein KVV02_007888 [Mortierella alpina]